MTWCPPRYLTSTCCNWSLFSSPSHSKPVPPLHVITFFSSPLPNSVIIKDTDPRSVCSLNWPPVLHLYYNSFSSCHHHPLLILLIAFSQCHTGFPNGLVGKETICSAGDVDLGWEDPLQEEMATHSHILAWRMPLTEEPGGLQFKGSQRAGRRWATEHTTILSYNCTPLPKVPFHKQVDIHPSSLSQESFSLRSIFWTVQNFILLYSINFIALTLKNKLSTHVSSLPHCIVNSESDCRDMRIDYECRD